MAESCIAITGVQVGHVIGKGGSTIKSIQETTGAKVEIIDGPQVRITADNEAAVRAAEAEVRSIIGNQENPDYEGPVGAQLRKEANALGDKRSNLYDEATVKRNAGDHAGANALVAKAKSTGEEMATKHALAAQEIAHYNNEAKGHGEGYLDMHGLREEEAMALLRARIALLEAKPTGVTTGLEVIPGAGHHSAPGTQKLMGATVALLTEKHYVYEEISAGSLMVTIPGTEEGLPSLPEEGDKIPASEHIPATDKDPVSDKGRDKGDKTSKREKKKSASCCVCM